MANTVLTASIIAKESIRILDNELVFGRKIFRGYEEEFAKNVNGFKVGSTVTIKKPAAFTVRTGRVMQAQNVVEGSTSITVDTQKGIDFKFTSEELTMDLDKLSERVIRPAMVTLANDIDADLLDMYQDIPNWVGTPGQTINSFADFAVGPLRLDEMAVPQDGRVSLLSPTDNWGLIGSQTALYTDSIVKPAYREGTMGMIANIDNYMSQNIPNHTNGAFGGTVKIDQALTSATISYTDVKDTGKQTIHIDGLTSATAQLAKGDVFTIAGVYDVNFHTKARKTYLKQFTIVETPAAAAGNEVDIVIAPAMIWSGAFQNVEVVGVSDLNNQDVTFVGSASTAYPQNLMFNQNAFAAVFVPMERPAGAVQVSRQTYNGLSVRVIPVYDGTNDENAWRLDVLYGKKTIDPRLAVRVSGTA